MLYKYVDTDSKERGASKFQQTCDNEQTVEQLHVVPSLLMKRAVHPRYMKLNQLSTSAVNMLMRRRRIFRFISLARTNASTHVSRAEMVEAPEM